MFQPKSALPINGDDDAQTIHRLETECCNLRVCMSKVRKGSREWHLLETMLKNANDELNAAKEDRDLMLDESSHGVIGYGITRTIEMAVQKIEDQLDSYPKFSPEWFELKEDLVELRIKLNEGGSGQLNTVVEESIVGSERTLDNEFQVDLPQQFHFRPISPPPSPSSTSSRSLSHFRSTIVQPCAGRPIPDLDSYDANVNNDEDDSVQQQALLRAQYAETCNELDKSLKFSQEWFAAKIKAVRLENKIVGLDDNKSNALVGSSNVSFTGWSENDEEVEAITCADELECAMVAEALKQGCCVSPSFAGEGNVQGRKGEFPDSVDIKLEDDEGNTYNECNSIETQSSLESQPGRDDGCSQPLLDSKESDLEIQNNHAVIIQKYWIDQSKCRVLKRLKSRALKYQITKNGIIQYEVAKSFRGEQCSRWETFAAVVIQSRWRCYLKQKLHRTNNVSTSEGKSSPSSLEEDKESNFQKKRSTSTYEQPSSTTKSRRRQLKSPKPQTMEELSKDCSKLSKRLNKLQRFTPEWTLVNVELKLITEEMEYLYSEILQLDT